MAGFVQACAVAQTPLTDAERVATARRDAPYRIYVPSKLPIGTRLLAVIIGPRSAHSPRQNRLTEFGLILSGKPYRIVSVIRGSLADRAGIQPGDELDEIDGQKAERLSPEALLERLDLGQKQKLELTVRRSAKSVQFTLTPGKNADAPTLAKQVIMTYVRKSQLLELIQYPDPKPLPTILPPAVKIFNISGHKGALLHIENSARLIWRQGGMAFLMSARDDTFTDAEMLAIARSVL